MKGNRTEYFEIVGITEDNEIIMLDSIFDHGDGFKGAVGSSFYALEQSEVDDRNDLENVIENYGYIWQEAVAAGNTTESQEKFIRGFINSSEGYFLGHDDSYIHHIKDEFQEKYFPDAVTFECVGGGRMFPITRKWKVLLRPDLLEIINKAEEKAA